MRALLKTANGWQPQHPPDLTAWLFAHDGDNTALVISPDSVYHCGGEELERECRKAGKVVGSFYQLAKNLFEEENARQ